MNFDASFLSLFPLLSFLIGEILLSISFCLKNSSTDLNDDVNHVSHLRKDSDVRTESPSRFSSSPSNSYSHVTLEDVASSKEDKSCVQKTFAGRIAQMFNKYSDTNSTTSIRDTDLSEPPETTKPEIYDNKPEDESSGTFEETMKMMESRDQGSEIPSNLSGVLLDQLYVISPADLNSLLFSPNSSFPKSLAEVQGTTELQQGSWKFDRDSESLKRVVTYIKAATRLVKAVKATEEQTYLKADGKVFAVFCSVSTPDVMYGSTFKTELLQCVTPGPELPSGQQSSRLVISWRMNFVQSTMMKGMIENGARQGLKDSFDQFATVLSQNVKPVDSKDLGSNKEKVLALLHAEPQSDWKLAVQYFANFSVVSTVFMGMYVLVHLWLATPSTIQGLEFVGLDLPDSIGEFIVCGVLVLQAERVLGLISRFMQARTQKGIWCTIFVSWLVVLSC